MGGLREEIKRNLGGKDTTDMRASLDPSSVGFPLKPTLQATARICPYNVCAPRW